MLLGPNGTVAGKRRFVERLDACALAETDDSAGVVEKEGQSLQSTLRRGWYWGSEAFKKRLLDAYGSESIEGSRRAMKSSPALRDHAEGCAEVIVRDGMKHYGMTEGDLTRKSRGDLRRASIAWAIWNRTSVPQLWIAKKLGMKSAGNVSRTVRRLDRMRKGKMNKSVWEWQKRLS